MIEPLTLTGLQQIAAIVGAVALFGLIIVLIYKRKLREDYGALWLAAATVTLVLAIWQDGLRLIARSLDTITLTAPIFLLSIFFLTLVAVLYSVRLSQMSRHQKQLAREITLLRARIADRRQPTADVERSTDEPTADVERSTDD